MTVVDLIRFNMIAKRNAFATLVVGWTIVNVAACHTLGVSSPPLSASLRTDSAQIGVRHSGSAYVANIGFVYTNTTKKSVSKTGCGSPPFPDLEKKVNEQWVAAYYPVYLLCLTKPDFMLRSGEEYRGVLQFMAFERGVTPCPRWKLIQLMASIALDGFLQRAQTRL